MAGHISLAEVRGGAVDLVDLLKINALMDAREAAEDAAARKLKGK